MRENGSHQRELWLDGLRGVAALSVAFFHYTASEMPSFYRSYWADPPEQNRHIYQGFPLRGFAAGPAMVRVFFVISGYSLAIGLPTIRRSSSTEDDQLRFYKKLSSALFRRGMRLFIPLVIWSGICHVLFYAGAHPEEPGTKYCPEAKTFPSSPVPLFRCYIGYLLDSVNFIDADALWNLGLNNTLWSLPFEFRGSVAIYVFLLGIANLKSNVRLCVMAAAVAFWWWEGTVEMPGFMFGLLMAESRKMYALRTESSSILPENGETSEKTHHTGSKKLSLTMASVLSFVVGLYLISLPGTDDGTIWPDYKYFFSSPRWSPDRFAFSYYHIGACLIVASLLGLPALRKALETPLPQFLGSISFALFLVHYPIYKMTKHVVSETTCWLLGGDFKQINGDGSMPSTLLATRLLTSLIEGALVLFLSIRLTPVLDQKPRSWAIRVEKMLSID